MRSVRTGQGGSRFGSDDPSGHEPPAMHWDDDEAATHAYQWEEEPAPLPSLEEQTRSDRRRPRSGGASPARVIPLLRAPQRVTPQPVIDVPAAGVPSLRAHVEAQRAAAERGALESHIRSRPAHVVIPVPPPPRELYTPAPTSVSVHMHPPAPYLPPQPARGSYPPPLPRERALDDGAGYAPESAYRRSSPPPMNAFQSSQLRSQPQAWARPARLPLSADEFVLPFGRRPARRGSRVWPLVMLLGAAAALYYGRDVIMPPRLGTAIVPVSPEGASLSIDGQELAPQGGLFKIPELATDRDHVIEISHKGYVSETRRVRLNPGEVRVLPSVDLEAMPGAIAGAAVPAHAADAARPGAAAKPEARKTGSAGVASAREAQAGLASRRPPPARPAAAPPMGKSASAVRTHRPVESTGEPPPPSPVVSGPDGVLRINSMPWAEVSIDGSVIGTTPQQRIALRPGRHKVKLVNPELGITKGFAIQVQPGETLTKLVTLVE